MIQKKPNMYVFYPIERFKDPNTGKWFLVKVIDSTTIASGFDHISQWFSFSSIKGEEYNIYGWDCLNFLEAPIKTEGAYPYSVKARIHHYTSEGEIIKITTATVGISGIE